MWTNKSTFTGFIEQEHEWTFPGSYSVIFVQWRLNKLSSWEQEKVSRLQKDTRSIRSTQTHLRVFYPVRCVSVWSSHLEISDHRWTFLRFRCDLWNLLPNTNTYQCQYKQTRTHMWLKLCTYETKRVIKCAISHAVLLWRAEEQHR